jgi:hypothetical protein
VLLENSAIEHISEQIRAQFPRLKAQRIEEVTYESPALPLSYSATRFVLRSTRSLNTNGCEVRSTTLIERKNTDVLVAGSNARIEQEPIVNGSPDQERRRGSGTAFALLACCQATKRTSAPVFLLWEVRNHGL